MRRFGVKDNKNPDLGLPVSLVHGANSLRLQAEDVKPTIHNQLHCSNTV
jgi:hypothetical protein